MMPPATSDRCDLRHKAAESSPSRHRRIGTVLPLLGALLAMPAAAAPAASGGTGFFLGGSRVATAAHVVTGCATISVAPEGGRVMPAAIVARDPALDLAVLEVAATAAARPVLSGEVAVGAALTAWGYPHASGRGPLHALPLTAVELPVPRPPDRMPMRGAVAAGGMSGAPLLDRQGRVAGMLLGRGDPAAPGAADLARALGFPVAEIAIALPARWLPAPDPGARPGAVVVARVVCRAG